jgi:hypothetical protein
MKEEQIKIDVGPLRDLSRPFIDDIALHIRHLYAIARRYCFIGPRFISNLKGLHYILKGLHDTVLDGVFSMSKKCILLAF